MSGKDDCIYNILGDCSEMNNAECDNYNCPHELLIEGFVKPIEVLLKEVEKHFDTLDRKDRAVAKILGMVINEYSDEVGQYVMDEIMGIERD